MSLSSENVVLSAFGTRTVLNFGCKILSRVLHFILNGLIFRQINLNIIGIANVRLQLLYTTILFLSREAFRCTIPKSKDLTSIHQYINLIWLVVPTGLIIIVCSLPFTLFIQSDNAEQYPYYFHACVFYALAAFIELLSEPLYLLVTHTLNYHVNIGIEMFGSIFGFTIQGLLVYLYKESALYYYGIGYIIYSSLITMSYYGYLVTRDEEERYRLFRIRSCKDLLITMSKPWLDGKQFNETKTFLKQGIWMKILTEGERYTMSLFNLVSYRDQAIYDTVNNIGSLLPRLIFSVLEESAYAYFQQTLSRDEAKRSQQPSPSSGDELNKSRAFKFLNKLLRFVSIMSLLVVVFGVPYSRTLLQLYGGSALAEGSGPMLLRLYCVYLLFLAINGITEAFSRATRTVEQLNQYTSLISIFAVVYVALFYVSLNLIGIHGIIITNCLNMLMRIIRNSFYISTYFGSADWREAFRFSSYYLFILVLSSLICCYSERWLRNPLIHLGFGGVLGVCVALLTWRLEKELVNFIWSIFKRKSS